MKLSCPGRPTACTETTAADEEPELLRPSAPRRHTLSAFLQVHAQHQYELLFSRAEVRSRTRLLSAGGATAGKSLVAPRGLEPAHFNDEEMTEILQWRLGIAVVAEQQTCQNVAAKTGERCGEDLGLYEDHAANCPCGPMRNRRHEDIADCLGQCIQETGAHVRRDAFIKALSVQGKEAWLDVWAFGGMRVRDLLIDVTVRHPMSDRYQPAVAGSWRHCSRCEKGET